MGVIGQSTPGDRPVLMIVDDTAYDRTAAAQCAAELGSYHVVEALDAVEAMHHLTDGPSPEVILLDLTMPGMDGVQFMAELSRMAYRGSLILTSNVEQQIVATAAGLGRERGLNVLGAERKPLSCKRLAELIAALDDNTPPCRPKPRPLPSADELRCAIRDREIEVYFQPKVCLSTHRVTGVEALARWRRSDGEVLPPALFIPLAEELNLIDTLSEVVLDKSLDHAGLWARRGLRLPLAVNMSMVTLNNLDTRVWDLPEYIVRETRRRGLAASDVSVELTESNLMTELVTPRETLTRMRLKGIRLAIDDFGTGYSSLAQLTKVPFAELKIDRGFVTGASGCWNARSILESSIDIAKRFGLKTVAEGVESQEDWDLSASLGCHEAQGFFIAEPMIPDSIPAWVAEWERAHCAPEVTKRTSDRAICP